MQDALLRPLESLHASGVILHPQVGQLNSTWVWTVRGNLTSTADRGSQQQILGAGPQDWAEEAEADGDSGAPPREVLTFQNYSPVEGWML